MISVIEEARNRPTVNLQKDIYSRYDFSWLESFFLFLRSFVLDYADLTKHIPVGSKIIDIGCGYGILANYLALSDPSSEVRGVDIDTARIKKAKESTLGRSNISFDAINFMTEDLSRYDRVLMIDVMHYFDYRLQDKVIKTIADQLRSQAVFIFRTPDTSPKWRYYWNFLHEFLMVKAAITKTDRASLFFRSSESLLHCLNEAGFDVTIFPNRSLFPYSDTLFICRKK
jgi:2-polyprenyl-3-methyl-5-hydroxy-6-metoxy-1,4-benzoquinol methylase